MRLACVAIGANGKPPCRGTGLARIRRDLPVLQVRLVDPPEGRTSAYQLMISFRAAVSRACLKGMCRSLS
jgi:hypothetical protein